jgi:hypothetical protein
MGKKKTEEEQLVDFIGETISTESALLACAITIMRAGNIAKNKENADALLKVAKAWYDLARYLGGEEEDKPNPIGFTSTLETLDEPGDEPDAGEGGPEIRKKSRKL